MPLATLMAGACLPEDRPLPGLLIAGDRSAAPQPAFGGVDEAVWIEVIHKMDEVYNDLLQYEVVLEQKKAALEDSQQFIESVLASMSDILIVCNRHGAIDEVNDSLRRFVGQDEAELRGRRRCRTASYGSWGAAVARYRCR